jgi:DNA replication protein DnaC
MQLEQALKKLRLPCFLANYQTLALAFEQQERFSAVEYLEELVRLQIESSATHKVARIIKLSGISTNKLLNTFDLAEVPSLLPSKLHELARGEFMAKAENVLIFGGTGTGKTHLCNGLANKWCVDGKRVYYTSAANLVSELTATQSAVNSRKFRQRLNRCDVVIIENVLQHHYTRQELMLLMNLLADYYEHKSVVISAHLPFARWTEALNDEASVATMIDKLVHHSHIIELNTESYRLKQAMQRKVEKEVVNS